MRGRWWRRQRRRGEGMSFVLVAFYSRGCSWNHAEEGARCYWCYRIFVFNVINLFVLNWPISVLVLILLWLLLSFLIFLLSLGHVHKDRLIEMFLAKNLAFFVEVPNSSELTICLNKCAYYDIDCTFKISRSNRWIDMHICTHTQASHLWAFLTPRN